jgi:outer membrane protein assembly factor BamA
VGLQAQSELRTDELEAEREAKLLQLTPDQPGPWERRLVWLQHSRWLNGLFGGGDGLRLRLGGLAQAQGFALGPTYTRTDLWGGRLSLRASLRGSTRKAYLADFGVTLPRLADGKAFFDLYTVHYNYPNLQFYGEGPRSSKHGRSVYRLENTSVAVKPGVRLMRGLTAGLIGSFQAINVGRGDNDALGHTEQIYTEAQAPGLVRQANFLQAGGFVQYDWRTEGAEPTSGGLYKAEYTVISDRDLGRHNFNKLDLTVQHYLPLFNRKRVFAVQGTTTLTDSHRGNTVPFYLQPVVGGAETLRGFRPFRFYDDNSMVLNGEYRFEAGSLLDIALFVDGGKVFHNWEQWNVHNLKSDVGFGLRFKGPQRLALRIDTAFSHEGVQVWFRFRNVF